MSVKRWVYSITAACATVVIAAGAASGEEPKAAPVPAMGTGLVQLDTTAPAVLDAGSDAAAFRSLVGQVYGDREQRAAGLRAQHQAYQTAIATCMTERGFSYAPLVGEEPASTIPVPDDSPFLAPLVTGFGAGQEWEEHIRLRDLNREIEAGSDEETKPGYVLAISDCASVAGSNMVSHLPNNRESARAALSELTKQAAANGAVHLERYRTCLAAAGFTTAAAAENPWLALVQQVNDAYASGDPRLTWLQVKASQEWTAATLLEKHAAATDAACRTTMYAAAVKRIRSTVDNLATSQAVTAVANAWQRIA